MYISYAKSQLNLLEYSLYKRVCAIVAKQKMSNTKHERAG